MKDIYFLCTHQMIVPIHLISLFMESENFLMSTFLQVWFWLKLAPVTILWMLFETYEIFTIT